LRPDPLKTDMTAVPSNSVFASFVAQRSPRPGGGYR
jgi:hypothetical protein